MPALLDRTHRPSPKGHKPRQRLQPRIVVPAQPRPDTLAIMLEAMPKLLEQHPGSAATAWDVTNVARVTGLLNTNSCNVLLVYLDQAFADLKRIDPANVMHAWNQSVSQVIIHGAYDPDKRRTASHHTNLRKKGTIVHVLSEDFRHSFCSASCLNDSTWHGKCFHPAWTVALQAFGELNLTWRVPITISPQSLPTVLAKATSKRFGTAIVMEDERPDESALLELDVRTYPIRKV